MTGLLDCNNFYASCERVFNPKLLHQPVVVLSNNDGCVIARSNEAKALGIKMGAPIFQIRELVEKHQVQVLSSNYTLYGDMSNRVITTLEAMVPEVEVYSIDEMFINFQGFTPAQRQELGREIVRTVKRHTGIPVCLGIAPTKALSKVANKWAKKHPEHGGFFQLETSDEIAACLREFPLDDVWGIGRQYFKVLDLHGVKTAFDFTQLPRAWVQQKMTVTGLRLWEELHGNPMLDLELEAPAKQTICTSRSFGQMLTTWSPVSEAVANHAARCAEKLRKQDSSAKVLTVFLHTNCFKPELPQYNPSITVNLPVASNSSMELIHHALVGLKAIFREGFMYKKAGIIVSGIVPAKSVQGNLFTPLNTEKHLRAMKVMDELNRKHGRDAVRVASQGYDNAWRLRQENLSGRFTTNWGELLVVHA